MQPYLLKSAQATKHIKQLPYHLLLALRVSHPSLEMFLHFLPCTGLWELRTLSMLPYIPFALTCRKKVDINIYIDALWLLTLVDRAIFEWTTTGQQLHFTRGAFWRSGTEYQKISEAMTVSNGFNRKQKGLLPSNALQHIIYPKKHSNIKHY